MGESKDLKPYELFRKIIKYCKLMDYDVNDILNMSDREMRIWYNRVVVMVMDESSFRIQTGMINDKGTSHKILSIIDAKGR